MRRAGDNNARSGGEAEYEKRNDYVTIRLVSVFSGCEVNGRHEGVWSNSLGNDGRAGMR